MLKWQVFKSGLYGLSVRNALAKTELKSDLKTRFYARKRKNAFLLYWWGDTAVLGSPVRDETTACPDDATVSVLQNLETSFFSCVCVLLSMPMNSKYLTLFNQSIIKLLRVS